MTRREAEQLIARIVTGELQPHLTRHVRERILSRRYHPHDVWAIVQVHHHMSTPRWDEEHGNFTVELHGRCVTAGRATVLVLGLRAESDCTYVTIMPEREFMTARARSRRSLRPRS